MKSLLKDIRDGYSVDSVNIEKPHDIQRPSLGNVYSKATHKNYRIVYDKRIICKQDWTTLPYGY